MPFLFFTPAGGSARLLLLYRRSFCFVISHFSVTGSLFLWKAFTQNAIFFLGIASTACFCVYYGEHGCGECGKMETKVGVVISKENARQRVRVSQVGKRFAFHHGVVCFCVYIERERERAGRSLALCTGCRSGNNGKSRQHQCQRENAL
jgi:hypothetical protein